jgi:hypothetical protein
MRLFFTKSHLSVEEISQPTKPKCLAWVLLDLPIAIRSSESGRMSIHSWERLMLIIVQAHLWSPPPLSLLWTSEAEFIDP